MPLRQALMRHEVTTAYERDWSSLKNGELLDAAEKQGFEVLVTTDSNLKYRRNLKSRRIAIVVLSTPSRPRIPRATLTMINSVQNNPHAQWSWARACR